MTIEIVGTPEKKTAVNITFWQCELWLTQAGVTYALADTAPGMLALDQLQGYFEGIEARLWEIAQEKKNPANVFSRIEERRLLRAVVEVLLVEINTLRAAAIPPLPPRTLAQMEAAVKARG